MPWAEMRDTYGRDGGPVDRDYDLFEKLRDGSVLWRAFVRGLLVLFLTEKSH